MSEKMILPTDAMVDEAANALCINATGASLSFQDDADKHTYRHRARVALRVVLNHPDAPGLFECDHTDYVHVDEAATRVEAAHEVHHHEAQEGVMHRTAGPADRAQEQRVVTVGRGRSIHVFILRVATDTARVYARANPAAT